MICLYIDTSSSFLYCGVVKDNTLLGQVKKELGQNLSKEALQEIIDLLKTLNIAPKKINKIYTVVGPGSFTGIRIGVTIAKTWAWALKIKVIPISSLEAMAISVEGVNIMPLINARRGYVYGAIYKNGNSIIKDQYILLDQLLEQAKKYDNMIIVTKDFFDLPYKTDDYTPDILKIIQTFKDRKDISPHLLNPVYLKKTEAEEKAGL